MPATVSFWLQRRHAGDWYCAIFVCNCHLRRRRLRGDDWYCDLTATTLLRFRSQLTDCDLKPVQVGVVSQVLIKFQSKRNLGFCILSCTRGSKVLSTIRVYSRLKKMEAGGEEEQDGLSVHSPSQALPSSASSLPKEHSQVELELRILQALEIYPPAKLQGIHRHFVLYGMMEYMRKSFGKHFTADEILQLLDRFFNLEMLKPDDEEMENINQEEDFSLPQSFFIKEE